MSTTTTAVQSNATKYRVAVRVIGVDNKFVFAQVDPFTDSFTRGDTVIHVRHNGNDRITEAEMVQGDSITRLPSSRGKMFVVQEWLTGIADEYDPKTGKGKRFINLSPEQVKLFESGKGVAKIIRATTNTVVAENLNGEAKAVTTPKAPAPKPAPKPRSRKAGTKVTAHTSVEDMGY
jgi:hypothetical protein